MNNSVAVAGTLSSRKERKRNRRTLQIMLYPNIDNISVELKNFQKNFGPGDIEDFNQQFIEILEDLRLDVQEHGIDLRNRKENDKYDYLTRLRKVGCAAFNKLFSREARQHLVELEGKEHDRGLRLTFITPPAFPLLWEMLYTGTPLGKIDPSQFWGLKYPLGRVYWDINHTDCLCLREGIISVIHDKLELSLKEVEHLEGYILRLCEVHSLKLTMQLLEKAIPFKTITSEELITQFRGFCFGMVHFACHCDNPQNGGATQACLILTFHGLELKLSLLDLLAYEDTGFINQPFVFLNACESDTHGHLLQTISFPNNMLRFGAGGVIATACTMPDNFASAFAAEFYRRLFEKLETNWSVNIGETLLETRLHFFKEYNNPLGLAYGLYAVSDQRLWLQEP
ncbi:MAG: CHAT domain-containing protein [Candidatus Competibacteraceae bacterium]